MSSAPAAFVGNRTSVRKPAASECAQVADLSVTVVANLRYGKVRRVLAALEKGYSEKYIASNEHISEADVRAVRRAYFQIVYRAIAIVRMQHENSRALIAELELDVLEQEVA